MIPRTLTRTMDTRKHLHLRNTDLRPCLPMLHGSHHRLVLQLSHGRCITDCLSFSGERPRIQRTWVSIRAKLMCRPLVF